MTDTLMSIHELKHNLILSQFSTQWLATVFTLIKERNYDKFTSGNK